MTCEGPLIWFDAGAPEDGALLECAAPACDYFVATGGFNDCSHAQTEWLKEGLA